MRKTPEGCRLSRMTIQKIPKILFFGQVRITPVRLSNIIMIHQKRNKINKYLLQNNQIKLTVFQRNSVLRRNLRMWQKQCVIWNFSQQKINAKKFIVRIRIFPDSTLTKNLFYVNGNAIYCRCVMYPKKLMEIYKIFRFYPLYIKKKLWYSIF